jgi:hypothetical protein
MSSCARLSLALVVVDTIIKILINIIKFCKNIIQKHQNSCLAYLTVDEEVTLKPQLHLLLAGKHSLH